jgi:serine/threonine-protein kinase RsbW
MWIKLWKDSDVPFSRRTATCHQSRRPVVPLDCEVRIPAQFLTDGVIFANHSRDLSMPEAYYFDEVLPSDTAAAQDLQERLVARLEELCYSPRDVFCIRLALEEAIVNAVKHGNRRDPSKRVFVRAEIDSQRIRVEIEDEGPGFDPEIVPDCLADENLDKPSGRGIMLMKTFLTSIEYNGRGNRVTLIKDRDDATSPE